jgi:hypothetical protein
MSVSTAYFPESKHSAIASLMDESDIGLEERIQTKLDQASWGNHILDVLSASAWQTSQTTLNYRWRGEGTLNWGDPKDWTQTGWVLCLIGASLDDYYNVCLEQYGALQDIVRVTRLQKLDKMYHSRDAIVVQRFLQDHPHLIDMVFEAYPYLMKHFGPAPQFVLEVVSDPEADGWDQLFAYIVTSLPVNQALTRLERFDEEWFLGQLDRVGDLFNFDLECV